jgi:hypothetical protein
MDACNLRVAICVVITIINVSMVVWSQRGWKRLYYKHKDLTDIIIKTYKDIIVEAVNLDIKEKVKNDTRPN